jgi:hypothetical protein
MHAARHRTGRNRMKDHWHEQVQRYVSGQANAKEAAALEAAMNENAELRTLYLDYMNLDAALGALADAATIPENGTSKTTTFARTTAQLLPHYWRRVAVTAGGAALVMLLLLPRHPDSSRERAIIAATISATQNAVARFSVETTSSLPAWMSPSASLLEPPDFSQ